MKKALSVLLAMLLVLSSVCLTVGAVTQSQIDDLRVPGDVVGSTVDIPTDMKVSLNGGSFSDDWTEFGYTDPSVTLAYETTVDMAPVRDKFNDYLRYAETIGLDSIMSEEEINNVTVEGEFEVYIKMSEKMGQAVEAMTPDINDNPILHPTSDMAGFTLTSINAVVTDIYTENGEARSWTKDTETGEYTLGITVVTKSPVTGEAVPPALEAPAPELPTTGGSVEGVSPLRVGDLKIGVGAPYGAYDYRDYLGDLKFEVSGITYNITDTPIIETVYGYVEGTTDFKADTVSISNVKYTAVQKESSEDYGAIIDTTVENDTIKSKKISATFEVRGENDRVKLTFVVNGTYLVPPAKSGVEYTDVLSPVYDSERIVFNSSDYTNIPGKRTKYKLVGWSFEPNGEIIDNYVFLEDAVLYAVFTERDTGGGTGVSSRITLHFVVDGDSSVVDAIVGSAPIIVNLNEIEVPEREGFVFDGWYSNGAYTAKVNTKYSTAVSATLYARYVKEDVPGTLTGDPHFAYVIGYPDGYVRPESNITREEITTIFYRLLKEDVRNRISTNVNDFSDVASDRWSNIAVSTMANGGYVKGYQDGTFLPGNFITRAEFVTIVARFLEDKTIERENFNDISEHWSMEYIMLAAGNGWITGYEDGSFRPDNYITRAEAMAIINRILVRYVNNDGIHNDAKQWPDNNPNAWYYFDVLEATNSHKFERQDDDIHENWVEITENPTWDN